MIRIIGGECKGRAIDTLDGEATRPTRAVVREAMFDILMPYVEGGRVLDLFAGSGALGLEALSRGAAEVCLTEINPKALRIIEKNISALGFEDRTQILRFSYEIALTKLMTTGKLFDIILLDPPYKMENQGNILKMCAKVANDNSILILERAKDIPASPDTGAWTLSRERRYGDTVLSIYRIVSDEDAR